MSCPYIDLNYPRCSETLNLSHLSEAFEHCTDKYMFCPLYLELSQQQPQQLELAAVTPETHY